MTAEIAETTVPVALVGLLRQCQEQATADGSPLTEDQIDSLCRVLYPHVDEAATLRRKLDAERGRVAQAERGGISPEQAAVLAQLTETAKLLAADPYARTLRGDGEKLILSEWVAAVLRARENAYAENLEFRRNNQEWDENLRRLVAERDALLRWQATCRQVAEILAPCYSASTPHSEHNVVWLAEKVAEEFDLLRGLHREQAAEINRLMDLLATPHHTAPAITSHTVEQCQRLTALEPLLRALHLYMTKRDGDTFHAFRNAYDAALGAGHLNDYAPRY